MQVRGDRGASWVLRTTLALGTAVMLVHCQADEHVFSPSHIISDGTHSGGNPNFFFLPPLVPDPSRDPNFDPGGFDPTVAPTVAICVLAGGTCAQPQPPGFPIEFTKTTGPGSETIRVSVSEEHYIVNWHAGDFGLDPALFYRLRVLASGTELGYADVDVVSSGREVRNVVTGEYIALVNGRTLPIKFRIERGGVVRIDVREAIAVADAARVATPVLINVHEAVHVTDEASVTPPVVVAVREQITVKDTQRILPPASVALREDIRVTTREGVAPPAHISITESIGVADAATATTN